MTRVAVLSAAASAINYILSLAGDPQIELHVTDADRFSPGLYGKNVIPHHLPPAREIDRYREALDHLIEEDKIDALIPTSDYDVKAVVALLEDGWSPGCAAFAPTCQAHDNLSDSGRLMDILKRRLPDLVPETIAGSAKLPKIGLPAVVKPIGLSGGKGVAIVETVDELRSAVEKVKTLYGDSFVLQEYLPGRTYVTTLVYDHRGKAVSRTVMRSTATFFTWGGGGRAGEMVDQPDLLDLAEVVVDACGGWRGPLNIEWRRRPDTDIFALMEVNCRLNGYSYLTTMNGICLPRIVLAAVLGQQIPPTRTVDMGRNFVIGFRETAVGDWVSAAN